jgi:hypothetical protein
MVTVNCSDLVDGSRDAKQTRKRKMNEECQSSNMSYDNQKRHKYECMSVAECSEVDTLVLVRYAETCGVDETPAQEISFALRSKAIRDDAVVGIMTHLIQRLYVLAIDGQRDITGIGRRCIINMSTFMSSYLILSHPKEVFESMGSMETKLVLKAKTMLQLVESMRRNILANVGLCQQLKSSRGLHKAMFEYTQTFNEWKHRDEKKIMMRLTHDFKAFLYVEQQLGDDETDTLYQKVQLQKKRLISTAYHIAGPGAIAELEVIRRHTMGDVGEPLQVDDASEICNDSDDYSLSSVLPKSLTNEELTHEVLLNGAFQLDKNGRPSSDRPIYSEIRERIDVAHWRSMKDDLSHTEPLYVRCTDIISEIKNNIDGLKFPALAGSTYPLFNMELLQDELASDPVTSQPVVTWDRYIQVIRYLSDGVVDAHTGHLCADGLDEWTSDDTTAMILSMKTTLDANIHGMEEVYTDQAVQSTCFVEALRLILKVVKGLCIMSANAHIRGIVEVLKNCGVQYLLDSAEKKIQSGEIVLNVTSVFIKEIIEQEVTSQRVELQDLVYNQVNTTAAYNNIVAEVVAKAFLSSNSLTLPETLLLDQDRLRCMRSRFDLHTLVAAALGVVNISLKEKKIGNNVEILRQLGICLLNSTRSTSDTNGRITEMVEKLSEQLSEEDVFYIEKSLIRNLAVGSLAFELTVTRMKALVFQTLHTDTVDILNGLTPCVVVSIGDELRMHMNVLRQVLRVNLLVYSTHYNRIIQETAASMEEL